METKRKPRPKRQPAEPLVGPLDRIRWWMPMARATAVILRYRKAGWEVALGDRRQIMVMSPSGNWYELSDTGDCTCPARGGKCKHRQLLADAGGGRPIREAIERCSDPKS